MILPARRPATAFGVADPFPPSDLSGSSRLLGRSLVAAFGAGSVAGRWLCLKSTAGVAPEPLEAPPGLNAPTMCWRCSGRFSPYSTTGFPSPFFPVPLPLALLPFVEVLLRSCSGGWGSPQATPRLSPSLRLLCLLWLLFLWLFPQLSLSLSL